MSVKPRGPGVRRPRRTWLKTAAGALAAAGVQRGLPAVAGAVVLPGSVACTKRASGRLQGPDVTLGHRLRTLIPAVGPRAVVDSSQPSSAGRFDVVIVGAGPSGLSAAWHLRRSGVDSVVVLDLEPRAGGTSVSREQGTVAAPWGAHYVPLPQASNPDLIELFDEMGVLESRDPPRGKERMLVRSPEERLFAGGQYHWGLFPKNWVTPEDGRQFQRFNEHMRSLAQARDQSGRRAFVLPMAHCSPEPRFTRWDNMSAAAWLSQHGYISPHLLWYVRYACRDDYGLEPEHTSAWAMLFYFVSRLDDTGHGAAPFLAWPKGNGAIVDHLVERVGQDRCRYRALVTNVTTNAAGVVVSYLDAETNTEHTVHAAHAIVAVPQFIASKIVAALEPDRIAASAEFSYSPWLVANLELSGRPRSVGVDVAWDSVIYDGAGLGFVDAQHQRLRDRGPTVWTYYRPLSEYEPSAARKYLLSASHAHLAQQVVKDIEQAHPDLTTYLQQVDVWRWGHAMVRPVPGFMWGAARQRASESLGRVHFAHSDLSGLALFEEAFYRGLTAARRVLSEKSGGEP